MTHHPHSNMVETYVRSILDFDHINLTEEQLTELYERLELPIFNIVNKNIQELRAYMELLERNSTAGDIRPHFKIKTRHPNIYSNDWREVEQQFIKKADTQAYINYHCQHGIKEEWKIEKVQ